jgi:hypothetical protein
MKKPPELQTDVIRGTLTGLVIAICLLEGCRHSDQPGQWILESYSADTGYVFRKDGVRYLAHCYNSMPPGVSSEDTRRNWERLTNGDGPPENECSEVLRYIHKPVPLTQEYQDDRLAFKDERGVLYEFRITEAKLTPNKER